MSPTALLSTVILASYGLVSTLLAFLVALLARGLITRARLTSDEWLALRLLPSFGAAFITLLMIVPAYLRNEPLHERETPGPLLIALAALAAISVAAATLRTLRALLATRSLSRQVSLIATLPGGSRCPVQIIESELPLVAVIGGWRPRILIASQVVEACTERELEYVLAHESAHVEARDNLKRWLMIASADVLCWVQAGRELTSSWQLACERAADERATAGSAEGHLHLASALIKVSRLASAPGPTLMAAGIPLTGFSSIEERIRSLLGPRRPLRRGFWLGVCAALLLLGVAAAALLHTSVHEGVEALVQLGL